MIADGNDYYYAHDHLYSPAALIDSSGTVLERCEYDAYGNPTIWNADFTTERDSSNYDNPYLFTGRRLDILDNSSLKIQYNRNRYYDYYTGRWLTHDPLGIVPNAQKPNVFDVVGQYSDGTNSYEYVHSNPLVGLDPSGLKTEGSKRMRVCYEVYVLDWWKGYVTEPGCCNYNLKIITWETPLKKAYWGDPSRNTRTYTTEWIWDDEKKECLHGWITFYNDKKREEGNIIERTPKRGGWFWCKCYCKYKVALTMRRYYAFKIEWGHDKVSWVKTKEECDYGRVIVPYPKIVPCYGRKPVLKSCD